MAEQALRREDFFVKTGTRREAGPGGAFPAVAPRGLNGNARAPEPQKIDFQAEVHFFHNDNDIGEAEGKDRMLFIVLFRRLSNADFLTLLKLFSLYSNCIVSFVGGAKQSS